MLSIFVGSPILLGVRAGVKTLNRKKLLKMLEELHANETGREQLLLAGEIVRTSPKSPTSHHDEADYLAPA